VLAFLREDITSEVSEKEKAECKYHIAGYFYPRFPSINPLSDPKFLLVKRW
jgi:hypothetical protein